MHVPAHFTADEAQLAGLLEPGLGDLVTATPSGLLCTPVPFVAEDGVLLAHLARANPQWSEPVVGEAMVVLHGPQGYVTPSWYAAKAEHGRVVPTWDYLTAHVYGTLVVHDDPDRVEHVVRRLTEAFEAGRDEPWSVDDAPRPFVEGQLRAIVAVELVVTRVVAKAKLSQNRTGDLDGIVAGLRRDGQGMLADAVERARPTSV
ncbi:MAG: FMN-binding negative transcriptional regulator [Frankiales bacterium]|nr:FMN-binding negative transcriptional regulator [Frankiales bacterium]